MLLPCGGTMNGKGTFTHARSGRGRRRAENCLQHNSLHAFTHTRSRSGGGAGAKSAPQQMGPSPNFPRPLRNRTFQTIFVLKKCQIRPRPLRVCVNIPAVASNSSCLRSATAPRICERSFSYLAESLTWLRLTWRQQGARASAAIILTILSLLLDTRSLLFCLSFVFLSSNPNEKWYNFFIGNGSSLSPFYEQKLTNSVLNLN